jgi:hypothetical protein
MSIFETDQDKLKDRKKDYPATLAEKHGFLRSKSCVPDTKTIRQTISPTIFRPLHASNEWTNITPKKQLKI